MEQGLDIYKHGEPAYPLVAYGHGWEENDQEQLARVRQLSMGSSSFSFVRSSNTQIQWASASWP